MASKTELALAWAARGYRVFPLSPNSRVPLFPDWDWSVNATTDERLIRLWWGAEPEANIGCCTGSGTLVIDIDVKHGGRGLETYTEHGGSFDTLTVRTTTGGWHLYFLGEGRNSSRRLGPGVDTRGDGGYVVAPGSTIDGSAYELVSDVPLRPLPEHTALALERHTVTGTTGLAELDTPSAVDGAKAWLATTSPAIEGQNGDAHTYRVACELRDRGVSEPVALDLMLEGWNERCLPPWDALELADKVRNAYAYGQNAPGSKHPGVLLGTEQGLAVSIPPIAQPAPQGAADDPLGPFRLGNAKPLAELRARPWLYRRYLLRGEITALVASGAAGKSLTTISTAIALALGIDFMGFELVTVGEPQNSIICNAEDPPDEMARRLYACCSAWQVDPARVIPHIALASGRDPAGRLILARKASGTIEINVEDVSKLLSVVHYQRVALLAIDPLVKMQSGLSESDNSEMNWPMDALQEIASKSGAAVLLAHHIAKPGTANTSIVGNADAARGASNIINSCRAAFTLAGPTEKDVGDHHLTPDQVARLVRLDDAKMNLSLKRVDHPLWMEKRTVKLATGDEVGVLVKADLTAQAAVSRRRMARSIYEEMVGRGTASLPLTEAAEIMRDLDPLYSKVTKAVAQARLERFFIEDAEVGDGHVLRLTPGAKRLITIV